MSSGLVHFSPSNISRPVGPRSAKIGPDGKYEIKTLVGDNNVNVEGPELSAKKFGRQSKIIRVESGSTTIDFDLPFDLH